MTEAEAIKFLKQRKDESIMDYLIRTREVYYERALNKLNESKKKLDKIMKKDVESGSFN